MKKIKFVVNYPTRRGIGYAAFNTEHKAKQFGFKYFRLCGWQFKVEEKMF